MNERMEFAKRIAKQAGDYTLTFFQHPGLKVYTKPDDSPVTDADRGTEEFLRKEIEAAYPDDGIVGEEYGVKESKSGTRWILDPIDGTKSFIRGVPLYGTMIGIEERGEPTMGVIRFPPLGLTLHAQRGGGCFLNEQRCRVSTTSRLRDASVMASAFDTIIRDWSERALLNVLTQTRLQRTWGDCYGHLLVARGDADIALDSIMHVWDVAPLIPIIQEAGGSISDANGNTSVDMTNAISSNGVLHEQIVSLIKNSL